MRASTFAKAIFLCTVLLFNAAQATVINFDDLDYTIIEDDDGDMFYEHPVTDQYLSKGLLIRDGFLAQYLYEIPDVASLPNALIGGEFFTLSFVNLFPTFVGMNVIGGGISGDATLFDIYSTSGSVTHARTGGFAHSPDESPYIPGEFISFNVPEGISHIEINSPYERRIVAAIDNLTYEYTSVPEPSILFLLGIGFLGIALRRGLFVN